MGHRFTTRLLGWTAAGLAALVAMPPPAAADDDRRGRGWGQHRGHGHGPAHRPGQWVHPQYGPSYRAPAYYHAPRPPRAYYAPPPVYYAPPPVYYAPPPVYYAPPPAYPGWGYPQGSVTFGLQVPLR